MLVSTTSAMRMIVLLNNAIESPTILLQKHSYLSHPVSILIVFPFQRRQEYLEDQLLHNRDQMLRLHTQTTPAHTRVGSAQRPVRPTSAHNGVVGEVNFQPAPGQRTVPQERHCTSPVEGLSSRGLHEPIQTHHYGWQVRREKKRVATLIAWYGF